MCRVQSLGLAGWKRKTNSQKSSSDLHMCDVARVNVHTCTKRKCKSQCLTLGKTDGGIAQRYSTWLTHTGPAALSLQHQTTMATVETVSKTHIIIRKHQDSSGSMVSEVNEYMIPGTTVKRGTEAGEPEATASHSCFPVHVSEEMPSSNVSRAW